MHHLWTRRCYQSLMVWRYPLVPPIRQPLRSISLYGRWSTCGSDRGIAHFLTLQKIQSTHLDSSSLTALDLISSDWSLCSGVDCLCPSSLANCQLLSPFVSLSDWCSLPTSGHAEISSPNPFVWFRAKTDKGIVCLAEYLHSVTMVHTVDFSNILKKRID